MKLVNWDYLYAVWKSVGLGQLLEEDELEELGLGGRSEEAIGLAAEDEDESS